MDLILNLIKNVNKFFILDSKGGKDSKSKYADNDYQYYCYNTKRFNLLKEGSIFLYRRPGRINKNRKFTIVGGGVIDKIIPQDNIGNVKATIKNGFKFTKPLEQGDPELENMKWTSKKKGNNWEHFWNQYGMNQINQTDFVNLAKHRNQFFIKDLQISDKLQEVTILGNEFTIVSASESNVKKMQRSNRDYIGRKIDFAEANRKKVAVGKIGEQIILSLLKEKAQKNNLKFPVHVSLVEGDGLGYDIKAYDENGHEKFIEVKTTTKSAVDGFNMSQNEVNCSREKGKDYSVYRLFNLNPVDMTVNLEIFNGPFNSDKYCLEPTEIRIFLK